MFATEGTVQVPVGEVTLEGDLGVPGGARGVVLFAHGSGSSRHSPRNRYVGGVLHQHSLATLLFDLLTAEEERADAYTGHLRFDIGLLSERLVAATVWACAHRETAGLPVGSSTCPSVVVSRSSSRVANPASRSHRAT